MPVRASFELQALLGDGRFVSTRLALKRLAAGTLVLKRSTNRATVHVVAASMKPFFSTFDLGSGRDTR